MLWALMGVVIIATTPLEVTCVAVIRDIYWLAMDWDVTVNFYLFI